MGALKAFSTSTLTDWYTFDINGNGCVILTHERARSCFRNHNVIDKQFLFLCRECIYKNHDCVSMKKSALWKGKGKGKGTGYFAVYPRASRHAIIAR